MEKVRSVTCGSSGPALRGVSREDRETHHVATFSVTLQVYPRHGGMMVVRRLGVPRRLLLAHLTSYPLVHLRHGSTRDEYKGVSYSSVKM